MGLGVGGGACFWVRILLWFGGLVALRGGVVASASFLGIEGCFTSLLVCSCGSVL